MNALDKLSVVEITEDSRISETDRQFCEAHQAAYVDAKASLNELEYMWLDINSRQTEALKPAAAIWNNVQKYTYLHHFSEQDIREKLEELNDLFISNLVRYFNHRYKVSLDADSTVSYTHLIIWDKLHHDVKIERCCYEQVIDGRRPFSHREAKQGR